MPLRLLLALLLVVPSGACEPLFGPDDPDILVAAHEGVYALDPEAFSVSVGFSATNRGGKDLYVSAGGDRLSAGLDRWQTDLDHADRGVWIQYAADVCLAVYTSSPLTLEPGETLRSYQSIREPGRYRLRIGTSAERGEPLQWTVTSRPFTVE